MSVDPGPGTAAPPRSPAAQPPAGTSPRRLSAHTLSNVAIVYGVIGLVLAALTFGAAFWVGGRFSETNDRMTARAERIEATLNASAVAIDSAAAAVSSAGATLEATATAIDSAATSVAAAATSLNNVADTAEGVSILGQQPLAGVGQGFHNTATHLTDLGTSLNGVATALRGNRAALAAAPATLTSLATSVRNVSEGLSEDVSASLDDVQAILTVTFLLAALWFGAPAVAALLFGLWLRRYRGDGAMVSGGT